MTFSKFKQSQDNANAFTLVKDSIKRVKEAYKSEKTPSLANLNVFQRLIKNVNITKIS